MAIGVSYRGHNGRSAQFTTEGNPAPGSELDKIVRGGNAGAEVSAVMNPLMQAMNRGRHPQAPDPRTDKAAGTVKLSDADYRPGTLSEKVKPDGSIKVDRDGLCLKGDDSSVSDGFYAKRNGVTAFLSLDDMDNPNERGEIVGALNVEDRFSTSDKTTGGQIGAYGVNMQSRTEADVNEETGEVTFWEYSKRIDITKGRRVGEFGSESKRKICSFFLGGDRQLTLGSNRALFYTARSHFVDEDGNVQYEYWMKNLKWGKEVDVDGFQSAEEKDFVVKNCISDAAGSNSDYPFFLIGGSYPYGEYGHYPKRPDGRPKLLKFDSHRMAIADVFEERTEEVFYNDNCNCWTYLGSSVEGVFGGHKDGNFDIYGYVYTYYKDNLWQSEHPRMIVTDRMMDSIDELKDFLNSYNSLYRKFKSNQSFYKKKNLFYITGWHSVLSVRDWSITAMNSVYSQITGSGSWINIVTENFPGDITDVKQRLPGYILDDNKTFCDVVNVDRYDGD